MAEQISITARIVRDIDESDNTLPVYGVVADEVATILDANGSIESLETALGRDPALTAEILHAANSAFFSGLGRVKTLHKAIDRLGAEPVRNLARAAVDNRRFEPGRTEFTELMTWIWQQSLAVAVGCRWAAEKSGVIIASDEAYFAGLLHHVGRSMVMASLKRLYEADEHWDLTPALIRELMRSLESDIGYKLMTTLELPELYAEIARDHDKHVVEGAHPVLLLVRLLDKLCGKLGIGAPTERHADTDIQTECRLLGLKPIHIAELEVLLEDLQQQWH